MTIDQDLLITIFFQLLAAAAIWGGIRADIKNMHFRMENVEESTKDLHKRLDTHIERAND